MSTNLQQLTAAFLVAFGVFLFVIFLWVMVGRQRTRSADADMRKSWEQTMATVPMPSYDGDTYAYEGWGVGELRRLTRDPAPTLSDMPVLTDLHLPPLKVPVSEVSGPLPVQPGEPVPADYDPTEDATAYIKEMEAKTQAFIASLSD